MGEKPGMIEELKVTVLAEDYAGQNSPYWGQHGAAYLLSIRARGKQSTILFDTGSFAEPVLYNLNKMKLDLADIEMIVLSHSHFDHTGGLTGILRAMGKDYVPVVAHPAINRTSFATEPFWFDAGYPMAEARREVEQAGGHWVLCASPLTLGTGIIYSGTVPRSTAFEPTQHRGLFTLEEEQVVADTIADDISLYFHTPAGLVVVTGCAHAGIVNILRHGVTLTGASRVAAVIGGFHLINADTDRISQTVTALQEYPGLRVFTGHCTGLKAEARLLDAYGKDFTKLYCGLVIEPLV